MVTERSEDPNIGQGNNLMDRRGFLKTSAMFGGAVAGAVIFPQNTLAKSSVSSITEIPVIAETEEEVLLREIGEYRTSLGLSPKTVDLTYTNPGHVSLWGLPPKEISFNAPQDFYKFYNLFDHLVSFMGPKAAALVRSCEIAPQSGGICQFYPLERKLGASLSVEHLEPDKLKSILLHEVYGHGTDPANFGGYPEDIRLKVTHGKWKALSQAFNVDGEFFHHPDDYTLPKLYRAVGEGVALKLVKGFRLNELFTNLSHAETIKLLLEGGETIKDSTDIMYSKKVCRNLGKLIFDKILAGETLISDESIQGTYNSAMEGALSETYAEMVRYVLDSNLTRRLKGNTAVITGIQAVFDTLGFDSSKISEFRPSSEEPLSLSPDNTVSPIQAGVKATPLATEDGAIYTESPLSLFVHKQQIPDSMVFYNQSDRFVLTSYLKMYSYLENLYPSLLSEFKIDSNPGTDFDSDKLHAWESDELSELIRREYVNQLFLEGVSTKAGSEELRERVIKVAKYLSKLTSPQ